MLAKSGWELVYCGLGLDFLRGADLVRVSVFFIQATGVDVLVRACVSHPTGRGLATLVITQIKAAILFAREEKLTSLAGIQTLLSPSRLDVHITPVPSSELGVNVLHIESRPSSRREAEFEILVDVQCDNKRMEQLVRMLRREVAAINLDQFEQGEELPPPTPLSAAASFGLGCWSFFIGMQSMASGVYSLVMEHETILTAAWHRMNNASLSQNSVGLSRNKPHEPLLTNVWGRE
uniref:ACT domain-containing protein n=1 Tax=Timema shepardi TaxID=629360 RepID=A0A7R9B434_TIMSH|nr:unnamed protein product [Timema shepardi]